MISVIKRLVLLYLVLCVPMQGALAQSTFPLGSAREATPMGGLFSGALSAAPLNAADAFRMEHRVDATGALELRWQVAEGYYLYRDHVAVVSAEGASLPVELPRGTLKEDDTFGRVEVFFGSAAARVVAPVEVLDVTYQGCQESGICYPPVTERLTLSGVSPPPEALYLEAETGTVSGILAQGGPLLVLAAFFGFGLLLALTPCVLPMVPILGSVLAGQGGNLTARRGIGLASVYVVAMASAFAILGVVAALSGQNLQVALQSPWVIVLVALLFGALALSMFGLYEISLPARWTARIDALGQGRGGSLGGVALLGFTSALIVGPCVTAPLAGALLYIGQTGDVVLGAAALFALGLGQGVPLLALGLFGPQVLPRRGAWMEVVTRLFGFVMLGMAIWMLGRLLSNQMTLALWAFWAVGIAIFIARYAPFSLLWRRAGAAVSTLAALTLGVGALTGAQDPLRPLAQLRGAMTEGEGAAIETRVVTNAQALTKALPRAGASLIYVTADWCVTCAELERSLFARADVQQALSEVTFIKADLSEPDAEAQGMLTALGAVGPPTMVFLDESRREVPQSRAVGKIAAETFLARLRQTTDPIKGELK